MLNIQMRLIGELIGLARATDGNEHLITESSTAVVVEGLTARDPEQMQALISKVEEVKRVMVPNCFTCASPCGRTSFYDLNSLNNLPADIRDIKVAILSEIQTLAAIYGGKFSHLLYKGLIVIGIEELPVENLEAILREIRSAKTTG